MFNNKKTSENDYYNNDYYNDSYDERVREFLEKNNKLKNKKKSNFHFHSNIVYFIVIPILVLIIIFSVKTIFTNANSKPQKAKKIEKTGIKENKQIQDLKLGCSLSRSFDGMVTATYDGDVISHGFSLEEVQNDIVSETIINVAPILWNDLQIQYGKLYEKIDGDQSLADYEKFHYKNPQSITVSDTINYYVRGKNNQIASCSIDVGASYHCVNGAYQSKVPEDYYSLPSEKGSYGCYVGPGDIYFNSWFNPGHNKANTIGTYSNKINSSIKTKIDGKMVLVENCDKYSKTTGSTSMPKYCYKLESLGSTACEHGACYVAILVNWHCSNKYLIGGIYCQDYKTSVSEVYKNNKSLIGYLPFLYNDENSIINRISQDNVLYSYPEKFPIRRVQ